MTNANKKNLTEYVKWAVWIVIACSGALVAYGSMKTSQADSIKANAAAIKANAERDKERERESKICDDKLFIILKEMRDKNAERDKLATQTATDVRWLRSMMEREFTKKATIAGKGSP